MQDRRELIKAIVEAVGPLIDARIKTAEVTINAHTDATIKAAEARIKTELRAELASKEDIKRLEQKYEKRLDDQKTRISLLEEDAEFPHSH